MEDKGVERWVEKVLFERNNWGCGMALNAELPMHVGDYCVIASGIFSEGTSLGIVSRSMTIAMGSPDQVLRVVGRL